MSNHIPQDLGLVSKRDATGKRIWYALIRCEGLKARRYGPFQTKVAARRFYHSALEGIDDFLGVEIPFDDEADLWKQDRKVGKVCMVAGTGKAS